MAAIIYEKETQTSVKSASKENRRKPKNQTREYQSHIQVSNSLQFIELLS